jgi:Na+-driven multidrug efflux pump
MTVEPPVFEERRRVADRRQGERREEDRSRFIRTAVAASVAICGALVVVYIFFGLVGSMNFKSAALASGTAIVLAVVWLSGYWWRHRNSGPRGPDPSGRERRGF